MKTVSNLISRFCKNQDGATAIEYGVLIAILAFGLLVGGNGIGIKVTDIWLSIANSVALT